ncbi:hypothetical protein PUW24_26045 [Paenibacillus urinalis]|uniref:WYL domain-containing protein n=1 Tax=Paenibacillus urinalis TaxID=521520 RepID=A0AAX3MVX2_9BACL|nr:MULTISPECIES: hypothetical protein [Paenibacillus]WDH81492.1 hypothetical protein PUW23_18450 [Paenibacillus urinalis]WDH97541.1 hypothetical protein PUW24_26045 [Paenibacillus urinalis]WDI01208.1 hypothetical protein PUW25_18285 [Paenibacillus urinalis]GAK39733.1 hypothetical protein TCA2_2222 [Paenibacillus sp. TCA20]
MPRKYIGKVVEIVYLDRAGQVSQRNIEIHRIVNGRIYSTCLHTGAPRTFNEENVLAWRPVRAIITA